MLPFVNFFFFLARRTSVVAVFQNTRRNVKRQKRRRAKSERAGEVKTLRASRIFEKSFKSLTVQKADRSPGALSRGAWDPTLRLAQSSHTPDSELLLPFSQPQPSFSHSPPCYNCQHLLFRNIWPLAQCFSSTQMSYHQMRPHCQLQKSHPFY